MRERLRRASSDEERITIHQRSERGDLGEAATRVLLGEAFDEIERERRAVTSAIELDTDGVSHG